MMLASRLYSVLAYLIFCTLVVCYRRIFETIFHHSMKPYQSLHDTNGLPASLLWTPFLKVYVMTKFIVHETRNVENNANEDASNLVGNP